jgi:hypothetical protein
MAFLTGCGDSNDDTTSEPDADVEDDEAPTGGRATGASCPPGSMLSYESFGEKFFSDYCTRCHSESVTGDARMNAPPDHNFDTLEGIKAEIEHVEEVAAAGPDATNTLMPPNGDAPSMDERLKLGEWIACGTP